MRGSSHAYTMSVTSWKNTTATAIISTKADSSGWVKLFDGVDVHVAHARPREDRLGDDRAAEDARQAEADERDQRQRGVLERVQER
jgi:hypothetical protein